MLTRTFVHIPRVGYATERQLWRGGVCSWEDALARAGPVAGFSPARWAMLRRFLVDSMHSLRGGDHRFFRETLPARDHWRAFPEFHNRVAYLDIETDGMSNWSRVTVVGLHDGTRTFSFVAGDNLDELPNKLEQYALLVTFNGCTFDLPFLRRRFGDIFHQLHVDLRFALGRLGYHGGLKAVELQLGLERDPSIAGLGGEDAVRLWHEWQRGSAEALELLLAYNRADTENLEPLMELAYRRLWEATGAEQSDAD